MKADDRVSRRGWLKRVAMAGGAATGALAAGSPVAAAARFCGLTPAQPEGPFYPVEERGDVDTDLTRVRGRLGRAKGEVIEIEGRVLDEECRPVAGALVEIWQACASGRYDHPGDPNPAPLDPDFQYWGEAVTGSDGAYRFRTIKPGAYPASGDWDRPPHIHYKVSRRGYRELITQMYFEGEPLNAKDYILLNLPPHEREQVVVAFEGRPVPVGRFDVTLQRP